MTIRELMERTGIDKTGKALIYAKEALQEIQMQTDDKMYDGTLFSDDIWNTAITNVATFDSNTDYTYWDDSTNNLAITSTGPLLTLNNAGSLDDGLKGFYRTFSMIYGRSYTIYIKASMTNTISLELKFGTTVNDSTYASSSIPHDTLEDDGVEKTFSLTFTATNTLTATLTVLGNFLSNTGNIVINKVWLVDNGISIEKDRRFYDLPSDMTKLERVYAKDQLNNNGEYHVIPRYIGDPPKEIDNE